MAVTFVQGSTHKLNIHVTNPKTVAFKYHLIVIVNGQTVDNITFPLGGGASQSVSTDLQMPSVSETTVLPVQIYAFEDNSSPPYDLGIVATDSIIIEYIPTSDIWTVTVVVSDIDTTELIANASITITSVGVYQPSNIVNPNFTETKTTNSTGMAVFNVPEAQYTMTITANGYKDYPMNIGYIRPDRTFPISMQKQSSTCKVGQKWDAVLARCVQPPQCTVPGFSVVGNNVSVNITSTIGATRTWRGVLRIYKDGTYAGFSILNELTLGNFESSVMTGILDWSGIPGTYRFVFDIYEKNWYDMRLGVSKDIILQ